jgi:hypothetical protein
LNRSLWHGTLTATRCPAWPCPICDKGNVALVQGSLKSEETEESKQSHAGDNWEPELIEHMFVAWGECKHPSCGQRFAIAGRGGVELLVGEEYETVAEDYFAAMYVYPMPKIIKIPPTCPISVRQELIASFGHFWNDTAACASRLRIALEELMQYLGMQTDPSNDKPTSRPKLHGAIEAFAKNSPEVGAQLMALKWLGNTGSHNSRVSRDDLLDAFEVLEHALSEIIERRSERVAELAKGLTAKHARRLPG